MLPTHDRSHYFPVVSLRSLRRVSTTTTQPRPRIISLDVIRGIAILGTLASNIWLFTAATEGENPASLAQEIARGGGAEAVFNAVTHLITDGKFLVLLTIMFGIGVEIQRQSAQHRGKRRSGGYYWRAGLLAREGLLNYIFVFEFDVLMGYGLTALAVAPILARSERVQKIVMWGAIVLHLGVILALNFAIGETYDGFDYDRADAETLLDTPTGAGFYRTTDSYWSMVQDRLNHFVNGRGEMPIHIVMGLAMFMVGAPLSRVGLFEPQKGALRTRVMALGFGFGIPLDWGLRLFATSEAALTIRYITSAMVAFGVLALVAEYYVRRGNRLGLAGRLLRNAGRMALSCYIAQNLIASVVFYDFGFARVIAGPWQTWWVVAIYAAICAVLTAFSALRLRRFERGPVEILMHMLYRAYACSAAVAATIAAGARTSPQPTYHPHGTRTPARRSWSAHSSVASDAQGVTTAPALTPINSAISSVVPVAAGSRAT